MLSEQREGVSSECINVRQVERKESYAMNRVTATERVRKELDALLTGKETPGDVRQFAGEFVRLAVRRLIQELLEAERTDFLGREAWERKPDRQGHRNGYEP